MTNLTGKTALITGGTTGIGLATAKRLLEAGARVAIIGQNAARVAEAGKTLGANVLAIRADVASRADMRAALSQVKEAFGTLDVLFANAGIAKPMPIEDVDDDNIADQIGVNLRGVILSVQASLPLLKNPSSVILTSSTVASRPIAGMSVYAATKAAVRSLAQTLSLELASRGVRVNTVSPGLTETPIYGKLGLPAEAVQAWADELIGQVPAARFASAEEIANAVLFLASNDSAYMLGADLRLDGGYSTL